MIMKYTILLFFILAFSTDFKTQGQTRIRYLTLDEAIEIAKAQSPDALNARQAFRSSYWEFRSYQASNLPELSLSAYLPTYVQAINPQYYNGVQSYSSYEYISANAKLALTQIIGLTGGTISMTSEANGVNNKKDTMNPRSYLTTPLKIVFHQPLFQFNPYRWNRIIQPLKFTQAKRKYIEDVEQISINTTNFFCKLLMAQVDKKIALTNLANSDTLYHISKGRYQVGKIAENQLLQMELKFLNAQTEVENTELLLYTAQLNFKSYLRINDSVNIILLPPADIKFFTIDPKTTMDLAVNNSSTSLDYNKRLLDAASAVNRSKMEGRFDVNLDAEIGLTQTGPTIQDAYYKPLDQRQFSLGITIPIVDWGVAHGKIKMAQSEEDRIKNQIEQQRIDFRRSVYIKAIQFNMQQKLLRIAAKSDTVASKSYEVAYNRYLVGKINDILDLNNAQTERDTNKKLYYSALQTFWTSYFEIRQMTLFDFLKNEPIQFDFRDVR